MKRVRTVKQAMCFIGVVVIALALCGCRVTSKEAQIVEPIPTTPGETSDPSDLPTTPPREVILMDGELVAASPSLKLSFSGNASGELLSLDVRVGQRVQAGVQIATLDGSQLQDAVEDAQLALDRAIEDRDKAQVDAEETYLRQLDDAKERYESELRQARQKLEAAQTALARAEMQPPTTSVAEAQANLVKAMDMEAQAHDEYKKALDRPWEPQSIRDSLYKEWQARIGDRKLAELRLQDAQIALQVYYLDLESKRQDVENAQADLQQVEMDEVKREESLAYDRAVEDAERKLADASKALEHTHLYAPWDGLVLSIDANVGTEVNSGTPIVTLINLERLYFVTDNLSERHIAQLRPGQRANITLRTYPDTVLTGQVDSIVPQSERTAQTEARFAAYIRLEVTELDLLPGMTGRVEVVTEPE